MNSTFYIYCVLALLIGFLGPNALALEIELQSDQVYTRTKSDVPLLAKKSEIAMANFVRGEKGGTTQLLKGSRIIIPDEFTKFNENGTVNLQATLKAWAEYEMNSPKNVKPEAFKAYEPNGSLSEKSAMYFPVQIKTAAPGSVYFSNKQNYIALLDLVQDFKVLPPTIEFQTLHTDTNVSAGNKAKPQLKFIEESHTAIPWLENQSQASKLNGLRCEMNSSGAKNTCEGIGPRFSKINSDHFVRLERGREKAFIEYMRPIAQYYQAITGFPASVMIAQAALETGYGTSRLFRKTNALFGQSCSKANAKRNWSFTAADQTFSAQGTCNTRRPRSEGGRYYDFKTREDSMIAYIQNMVFDKSDYYSGIRKEIQSTQAQETDAVVSWKDVVNGNPKAKKKCDRGLANYATDKNYRKKISSVIQKHNLQQLDHNDCQNCLILAGKNKSTPTNIVAEGTVRTTLKPGVH